MISEITQRIIEMMNQMDAISYICIGRFCIGMKSNE
jgi:hypothetical protein